jgi:hypothetical protein
VPVPKETLGQIAGDKSRTSRYKTTQSSILPGGFKRNRILLPAADYPVNCAAQLNTIEESSRSEPTSFWTLNGN